MASPSTPVATTTPTTSPAPAASVAVPATPAGVTTTAPSAAGGGGPGRRTLLRGFTTAGIPGGADARERRSMSRRRPTRSATAPALHSGEGDGMLVDIKDRFEAHPRWNPVFASAVRVLRATFYAAKDSTAMANAFTAVGVLPSSPVARIRKLRVPRREDLVLDGMSAEDAKGVIVAEWVDFARGRRGSVSASSASTSTAVVEAADSQAEDVAPSAAASPQADRRVVLYLHGGAYFFGSRKTHRSMTWRISKYAKAPLLVVDYRLSPKSVFPLALQDALSSYLYLVNQCGYKPSEIVLSGDSAGGGLCFAVLLWLRENAARGFGMPAGAALLSPWMDLTHSMASFHVHGSHDYLPAVAGDPKFISASRRHYYVTDNSQLTNPLVSPFFSKEDPSNPLPPLYIHAGELERLRDEIMYAVGHNYPTSTIELEVYEGMVHVFPLFSMVLKVGDVALQHIGDYIRRVTDKSPGAAGCRRRLVFIEMEAPFRERELTVAEMDRMIEQTSAKLAVRSPSQSSIAVPASSPSEPVAVSV
ncbi:hypothetical protein HK405_010528 [Cladochytrium tenue]|nr:hypothetical protein HK405_010528 [Cladochytrium tenue]